MLGDAERKLLLVMMLIFGCVGVGVVLKQLMFVQW